MSALNFLSHTQKKNKNKITGDSVAELSLGALWEAKISKA